MNTQEFLHVMTKGTKAEIESFIDNMENDAEYKAYREAHPESRSSLAGMTREEQTERIVDLIMQLAEREQQKQQEHHIQLKNLLEYQNIASKDCTEMINYISTEQSTGHYGEGNECLLFLDAFNMGYIQGKRAERARRKGAKV